VHRLEPLSLLLGILVWDGADEVVAPAALADLAWVCLERAHAHDQAEQAQAAPDGGNPAITAARLGTGHGS
jgi:hypothetical protein